MKKYRDVKWEYKVWKPSVLDPWYVLLECKENTGRTKEWFYLPAGRHNHSKDGFETEEVAIAKVREVCKAMEINPIDKEGKPLFYPIFKEEDRLE